MTSSLDILVVEKTFNSSGAPRGARYRLLSESTSAENNAYEHFSLTPRDFSTAHDRERVETAALFAFFVHPGERFVLEIPVHSISLYRDVT